ncbi:MAG: ACT domain-containing protein, partial [Endozoicomonas sp.]
GFILNTMNMVPSVCGEKLEVSISMSSERPSHLLISQLEKLHDVLQLTSIEKTIKQNSSRN